VPLAFRAFYAIITTLVFAIRHIVLMGSEKKMVWVNAVRNIAMMANKHSIWDLAIIHFPRNAMRAKGFAIMSAFIDDAMTPLFLCARPKPACVGLIDHAPESNGKGGAFYSHDRSLALFTLRGNA
jgi:hypothetical protein